MFEHTDSEDQNARRNVWPIPVVTPAVGGQSGRWLRNARRFLRRNITVLIGFLVIGIWVVVSIFAPFFAPYGPLKQDIVNRLDPPNLEHLLGTDELGRDILSRVIFGSRLSLPVGLAVVLVAGLVGTIVGSVAGYFGGAWDQILMRLTDLVMSFPPIILALLIAAVLGPGTVNSAIAIIAVWWPRYARLLRSLVLSIKHNEYVLASQAVGARSERILLRTILPNCQGPAVVQGTLDVGRAILTYAGLSFLGLGAIPPAPEWGSMVAGGMLVFGQWWVAAFPGMAIYSIVLALNFAGDGLRDALDPTLRNSL